MSFERWCANYNGIVSKICDAGIKYADVEDIMQTGLDRFPCFKYRKCTIVCDKRRWFTDDEIRQQEEKLNRAILRFNELLQQYMSSIVKIALLERSK